MSEKSKSFAEKYADFTTPIALVAIGVGGLVGGPIGAGLVAGGAFDIATNLTIKNYTNKKN